MSWQLAEVAPAAPMLPPLIILAGLVVALGFVMLIDGIVRGLFNAIRQFVSNIPFAGGALDTAVHHAEQTISNALGHAISGIETRIATEWHTLARAMLYFWHSLEQAAEDIYHVAQLVGGAVTHPDLNALQKRLRHLIHSAEHRADVAIAHALHIAKTFTHSVAHGVYPRLRAAEHAIEKTIPREIKSTRALAREAERTALKAWNLVKTQPWAVGSVAFAGAVAIALSSLGLGWLRCNSNPFNNNKNACGLWSDLEALLGLATLVIAAEDFETLVHEAQTLTEDGIRAFEDVFGLSG